MTVQGPPFTFPELLRGLVSFVSAEGGGAQRSYAMTLDLLWVVRDLGTFFDDPRHRLRVRGEVRCDALGGRLPVRRGWVDLFGSGPDGSVVMVYSLDLTAPTGELRLRGTKAIVHDRAWDLWRDTTTLHVQVHGSGSGTDPVVRGDVRLSFPQVLRSIAGMRMRGGPLRSIRARVEFDRFFLSRLAYVYLSPVRPRHP